MSYLDGGALSASLKASNDLYSAGSTARLFQFRMVRGKKELVNTVDLV